MLKTSCSMHKKITNVTNTTTSGIEDNHNIIFLLKYHIYYAPKGIARFPDGGRIKSALKKYYIYKYNKPTKKLTNIGELDFNIIDKIFIFKYINIAHYKNHYFFLFNYHKNNKKKYEMFIFNKKNGNIKFDNTINKNIHFDHKNYVSITQTARLFKKLIFYQKNGLPDPIPFIKKSQKDSSLSRIVYQSKGNKQLRLAIIGKFIKEKKYETITDILNKYSDYKNPAIEFFRNKEKSLIQNILKKYKDI